jgi:2-polyprenyl-6-methoxyphenol hydroxylase-like FAD-dependent oxidoreductase
MTTVLISGAGVAGPTLAYWLARHGFQPTVVERAEGLRSSGNPVDVRGQAMPIAERMGLVQALRDAATTAKALSLIDASGREIVRIPTPAAKGTEIELPRTDLAAILYDAAKADAEWMFHDTITALEQDQNGVNVTFEHQAPRRFDLVVGADGLHSNVRRLAFGPEREYVHHLGGYIATVPFGRSADQQDLVQLYNTPGRLVAIHPSRDNAGAAFIFRRPVVDDLDYRDLAQHKRIVAEAYAGIGWRVPELLDLLQAADDVYFDGISVVRIPTWANGRVVLLGDAASCVSLFGDGSSHAMVAAYELARALANTDHDRAFRTYEHEHRRRVEPKQRAVGWSAAMLVPKTRLGIALRNTAARVLPILTSSDRSR